MTFDWFSLEKCTVPMDHKLCKDERGRSCAVGDGDISTFGKMGLQSSAIIRDQ
jgi:hypothetical protein